ncbi:MAG: polyprenol monophosphomannose synthase [Candidatus Methylacidiphilales bacterium]|nr:polyprenol monophosphomannose synthase [Candidatus Methylacidiphilales bacterium]
MGDSDLTLVIIPTYRERENLVEVTERLWKTDESLHLLIVDDASGDGTPEWIRQHPRFSTSLFLMERDGKQGLATAYLQGFQWALARPYQRVVQMDADLSHDPAMLPVMLAELTRDCDLVLGSRYINGVRVLNWPISRLLLSLFAAQYVRTLTRMPMTDPTGGFKCFRRNVLEKLPLTHVRSTGYAFQVEITYIAWRLGFRIREIPIVFEDRHAGTSKMSQSIAREAIWRILCLAFKNFLPASRL